MPNQNDLNLYRVTYDRRNGYDSVEETLFFRAPSALYVGFAVAYDYGMYDIAEIFEQMLEDEDLFFDQLVFHYKKYNNFDIQELSLEDEWMDIGEAFLYDLHIELCDPDNKYDYIEIPDLPVEDVRNLLKPENDVKRVELFEALLQAHLSRGSVIPDKIIQEIDKLRFELAVKICEHNG